MKADERFTNRVENYHLYRPTYADKLLKDLENLKNPSGVNRIAEIGSGTGILSKQLLQAEWGVTGIEPNDAMRTVAEAKLKQFPDFYSIKGSAETTTLAADSIGIVLAAQAFHWFDPEAARKEFMRILRAKGKVVLVWNIRQHSTEFLKAYEDFLHRYSTDYQLVDHQRFDWKGVAYFFRNQYQRKEAPNSQLMDWQHLWGYYKSCSYALTQEHTDFDQSKTALHKIFDKYARRGHVDMFFHTIWYKGSLS
ncbi:ubiquinone/menaquinone biosynthesis C-methylase UbiE [Catalinimonas alkaloidigena]|uniref:class I SAM-dependent methyltransferase n=1 Tax=Catalinimonas alkaloidigena TaxID=1075417 RepID=UPI0024076F48|nr:class I SAM-dependent methyltransferase [Catalinimonas alkaloidigena]MDF9799649.1 ubiquinone/menaquinone biosynthesis C-methylase UbiE [Catalinimonas alkaloidigena]